MGPQKIVLGMGDLRPTEQDRKQTPGILPHSPTPGGMGEKPPNLKPLPLQGSLSLLSGFLFPRLILSLAVSPPGPHVLHYPVCLSVSLPFAVSLLP